MFRKIPEEELDSLKTRIIEDLDDNRKPYIKTITYMDTCMTFSIAALKAIAECNRTDLLVYCVICNELSKNEYVVTVNRNHIKTETLATDSSISKSISKLSSLGLIDIVAKDTYRIPIDVAYKGNLTKIVSKYKAKQEEAEREEKEKAARESIRALSIKRSSKLKAKEN